MTPAAIAGGGQLPGMNTGTFEHWPDSNMTKAKWFNYTASDGNSNSIEMFVPISAF